MEVILARNAGFCSGVKKAVGIALGASDKNQLKYTLGPLIHNRHIVNELKEKGIVPVSNLDEISEGIVIIRSHGVAPSTLEKAKSKDLEVVDATCPFVKKAQNIAYRLSQEDYEILIVGDHGHPEVEALYGWSGNKAHIVSSLDEANKLTLNTSRKIALIAQTTQPKSNLEKILTSLEEKNLNIEVFNTICSAAHKRQEAALSLASEVDIMIVIGGFNSANTKKLVELSSNTCATYHIEDQNEIEDKWFVGVSKVGVTAGASTPDWIIEEVVDRMVQINENNNEEVKADGENEQSQATEEINDSEANVSVKPINKGDVVKGKVVQVNKEDVMVDIGGKSEGIIPIHELSVSNIDNTHEIVEVGSEIEVQIVKTEGDEGNPVLSKKRVDRIRAWEKLQHAYDNNITIEGTAIEMVKGGILVDVELRGFVPASLIERGFIEDLEVYIGKNLRLKVIELDKDKNKIVLSQKAVLDEEYENKRNLTWDSLEEGEVIKGTVQRLTNFGAFIDIGGIDGLLHVSEVSWGRVEYPGDVLNEGEEIQVKVINFDKEKDRVSLSLKQLADNPWNDILDRYSEGDIVEGEVLRTTSFGAFVEVEPGVEGLVHISQLSEEHIKSTEEKVSVGDTIAVKILSINPKEQRMSLSLKEAENKAGNETKDTSNTEEDSSDDSDDAGVKIGDIYGDLLRKKANEKK